jgi:hypothetical protein
LQHDWKTTNDIHTPTDFVIWWSLRGRQIANELRADLLLTKTPIKFKFFIFSRKLASAGASKKASAPVFTRSFSTQQQFNRVELHRAAFTRRAKGKTTGKVKLS